MNIVYLIACDTIHRHRRHAFFNALMFFSFPVDFQPGPQGCLGHLLSKQGYAWPSVDVLLVY